MLFIVSAVVAFAACAALAAPVTCEREFARTPGCVKPGEQPWRSEICLNGLWQFQPVPGSASDLPAPAEGRWSATPIKIPSPWNVNAWGCGRTPPPLRPDSVYFPGYPAAWDDARAGWLRRTFRVPSDWAGRRIVLHFEAVAGDCQVLVNGRPAGTHFDKYLPFELDVTDLVRRDADNELRVGVRAHSLFDRQSATYPRMHKPYPCGSETERLVGIWQDVFLLGLPAVRVADVFVKPLVAADTLELEITLRNDSGQPRSVTVEGAIAGAFPFPATNLVVAGEAKVLLRERVGGRLKPWAPGTPNLYDAAVSLRHGEALADRHVVRFGWRQFAIRGRELTLNGQPIKLVGDFLHPFGPFVLSPDYARAWYRFIQDFGGNTARLHAQPHPRHYLDVADEMGIILLDETAIFGSSIALNFEEPAAWERFDAHYDGLVLRDRNHPSVLGWSFGNELFAIFEHNSVPAEVADGWYRRLAQLGRRALRLDPTRDWISCDGDEDLRGALPVWSKHFGHGTPLDRLPDMDKPLMVGESGGTYYARPAQLAAFNGPRAYESYAGRNEALAIDVYDNIVRMARPRLAFYSASETAWFGAEHLSYGYRDFTRPPGAGDGVFFSAPFAEGKPGIQPERLPPFVATLNPGWDPGLPPYKPLAMFEAQKAALAGQPSPWDHRPAIAARPSAPQPSIEKVGFIGDRQGPLARRLAVIGVPLADGPQALMIADGRGRNLTDRLPADSMVLMMLDPEQRTDRPATMLSPDPTHPWTAPFALPDLYFAEDGADRFIMRGGIDGPGRVLLRAGDTDWSLFNSAPENAKCAAVLLGERLAKAPGAALIERTPGRLVLCSLDYRVATKFWRKLFANIGIKLAAASELTPAFDENGVLVNAQVAGRFPAPGPDEATSWKPAACPSRDRFLFHELKQDGPEQGEFSVYFSFWVRSPRALDDLLAGGPDVPQVQLLCYVADRCRVFLNGAELVPARTSPADYRTLCEFRRVPLKKDWNRFVIKVTASRLRGDTPGTLAVRLGATQEQYFRQLESAVDPVRKSQ